MTGRDACGFGFLTVTVLFELEFFFFFFFFFCKSCAHIFSNIFCQILLKFCMLSCYDMNTCIYGLEPLI